MLIMNSFIEPCQCRANLIRFSIKNEENGNVLPTIPFSNTMQPTFILIIQEFIQKNSANFRKELNNLQLHAMSNLM